MRWDTAATINKRSKLSFIIVRNENKCNNGEIMKFRHFVNTYSIKRVTITRKKNVTLTVKFSTYFYL